MTVTPPPPADDDIVGRVVEKAAEKAAAVAIDPAIALPKINAWIRFGVFGVLALIILSFANIILNVQTKNAVDTNILKVEAACKLAALSAGAQEAPTGTLRLAECLD